MTNYVVGTPGTSPRFIMQSNLETAQMQAKSGEVCFEQASIPSAPYRINDEGTELVGIAPDPAQVAALAWAKIKMVRNAKLNNYAWTVAPGSPLSEANQADWLGWIKAMNRLTIDYSDPEAVVWPSEPALVYA